MNSNEAVSPPRPAVVLWMRIYLIATAILYFLTVAFGALMLIFNPPAELNLDPVAFKIYGACFVVICAPFVIVHLIPLFMKPTPAAWTFDLVLLCLGLAGCCLPTNLALMYFWLKPETKAYFGKTN